MFTFDITIDRITAEQFSRLQGYWYSTITMDPDDQFGVVVTPVQTHSVEEMLYLVMDHPLCDQICVRGDSDLWNKIYRRKINSSNKTQVIQALAAIVRRADEIDNHFDVKLCEPQSDDSHVEDSWKWDAKIYFRGYKGMVVGVDMFIPPAYHHIFDLGPSFTNAYIKAQWDPEGVIRRR